MACGNDYEENVDNLLKLVYLHNIVSFRVREVRCTAGSSSGDNYMSVVKRVQIIENNEAAAAEQNDTNVISLIIKRQIPSLSRRQLYRCDEAFCNEIYAYTNVVPLLEQYISEPLFPKCFFAGKDEMGEIIMLEDLKSLGYHMQNRLTGLNVTYCELVMKELAKLHAASIAAKQLNTELFRKKCKHIRDIVYCKEAAEFYRNILETSIQESLGSLRISNIDGCLSEPIRLIEKLQSKLFSKIQNFVINSKESLNVMCHGDLWVNNIMFKNVAVTTSDVNTPSTQVNCTIPSAVKFIDLQAMRYTSPVIDILHFIYTSTKRELRETYLKPLLQTYCVTLLANLEIQFNKARETENFKQLERVKDTFSLHNITQEYFEHVLYGLAISMWILPAVTFDPNNIPNLDQISETTPNAKEIKCTQKLTQEYHSRVKELALEFYQNGYLNSYLDDE